MQYWSPAATGNFGVGRQTSRNYSNMLYHRLWRWNNTDTTLDNRNAPIGLEPTIGNGKNVFWSTVSKMDKTDKFDTRTFQLQMIIYNNLHI